MSINHIQKSVLLPYSAAQVFSVVEGIEAYPDFLPWCSASAVERDGKGGVIATLSIDYLGLRQKFTTRNHHEQDQRIDMTLLDGPFTELEGQWLFHELADDGCKAEFNLRYQMRGGLLGRALSPVFGKISATMVDAFVAEANNRYG